MKAKHGLVLTIAAGLLSSLVPGTVSASQLVYTPINPIFGGNPFNGEFLLSLALEQRPEEDSGGSDGGGSGNNPATSLLSDLIRSEGNGTSDSGF